MGRMKLSEVEVTCGDCGKVFNYHRSNRNGASKTTCNSCNVQRRRRKLKIMAIEYKGGKCAICGYNKFAGALDFHHLDSSQKSYGISAKGYTRSFESMKKELDKCILVCANCHREIEAGLIDLMLHGVMVT